MIAQGCPRRAQSASMQVGGAASLTDLMQYCAALAAKRLATELSTCNAIVHQLKYFAGVQIRNVATLAGNIVTGSPISDLNPVWVATGATFTLQSKKGGSREVPADRFFLGYRCARCCALVIE
jgi:xanthine dehydrogenase/oxidase